MKRGYMKNAWYRKAIVNKHIIILLLLAGCLVLKSFFGFGWDDEGYYLAMVHRFWVGDLPIYHEWHPTQWYAVLLLPVYGVYRTISGGEGIVLFFRLFYLAIRLMISLIAFAVIKIYTKKDGTAFFSAVILLIFCKENMALYSYSDLAVSGFALSVVLLLYGEWTAHRKKWIYFAAGLGFVAAVFSNPYMLVIYVYFVLLAVVLWKRKKETSYLSCLVVFTAACCLVGFSFLGYLAVRVPPVDLREALYYITHNPQHELHNPFISVMKWCWYAVKPYHIVVLPLLGSFLLAGKGKHIKEVFYGEMLCAVLYVVIQYFFMEDKNVIGIAYIPLSVFGLFCFYITRKRDWISMLLLYIPGILMSVAFHCASMTGIFTMTTGFSISAMASVIFIDHLLCEQKELCSWKTVNVFLGLLLLYTGIIRVVYCRFNTYEAAYNTRLENGPYKGILTDAAQKEFYEEALSELALLEEETSKEENILIMGNNMWMYLCVDRQVGSPVIWRAEADYPLFESYFVMHPDKLPAVIYANELCEMQYGDRILLNGVAYEVKYSGDGKVYDRR